MSVSRDTCNFLDVEVLRSGRTPLRQHPPPWPLLLLITYVTYNIDVHSITSAETRDQLTGVRPISSHNGSSGLGPAHQRGGLRSHKVPEP